MTKVMLQKMMREPFSFLLGLSAKCWEVLLLSSLNVVLSKLELAKTFYHILTTHCDREAAVQVFSRYQCADNIRSTLPSLSLLFPSLTRLNPFAHDMEERIYVLNWDLRVGKLDL
jgi:hypothetical protein